MGRLNNVLVVGAGIGGMAAAIALARRGIAVDVIEINPQHNVYGVGIIQPPNALRVLDQLGLLDECYAHGLGADEWLWRHPNGKIISVTRSLRLADPNRPAYNNIRRPDLQSIMLAAASRLGVAIELGCSIEDYQDGPDGIEVQLTTGASRHYDLVIGFDGIRSPLRTRLFGDQYAPHYQGHAVWRANLPRPEHVRCAQIYFGYGNKAGVIPLSKAQMYVWVVVNRRTISRIERDQFVPEIRRHLAPFGGDIAPAVDDIKTPDQVVFSPVEEVSLPPPWHKGRVLIAGDAAHASGPHLGQGAAMALEDAALIAQLADEPTSITEKLATFTARRYPRAKFVQDASHEHGVRGQWDNPVKCFIRNHLVLPRVLDKGWLAIEERLAAEI